MKHKKIALIISVLMIVFLSACHRKEIRQSTDLSEITIGGLRIGDGISTINTLNFTTTDHFSTETESSADTVYSFEECEIVTSNDIITKITGICSEVEISVKGEKEIRSVSDVEAIFGHNDSTWYDREQSLKQLSYADDKAHLRCMFVYDSHNHDIVWAILETQ